MASLKGRLFDYGCATASLVIAPWTKIIARRSRWMPQTQRILDRWGISYIEHHYYTPVVLPSDIRSDLTKERNLPGIDLNVIEQLAILRQFNYGDEIQKISNLPKSELTYSFKQPSFGAGDAEYLYSMIRHFKPAKIVEVGGGESTKMIRHAVRANAEADPSYACEHLCIEPYENPWLERLDAKVLRQRVEEVGLDLFRELGPNDILFIDSSHVIRPQGDVVFLYLMALPILAPGVFVHTHDILTPRDYFPEWVLNQRLLWNELYLLEAFLSLNSSFKITGALNWLWHNHREETHRAFPVLAVTSHDDPGSFWFQRK